MERAPITDRRETTEELRETWAGHILLDELNQEEWRETMWAPVLAGLLSQSALARDVGLPERALRAFLRGAELRERYWDRVGDWCAGKPLATPVVPEVVALRLLARFADGSEAMIDAQRAFAAYVREFYIGKRTRLPAEILNAITAVAMWAAGGALRPDQFHTSECSDHAEEKGRRVEETPRHGTQRD